METKDIIILGFVVIIVAVRLYAKYGSKSDVKGFFSSKGTQKKDSGNSGDDYEPYSGK